MRLAIFKLGQIRREEFFLVHPFFSLVYLLVISDFFFVVPVMLSCFLNLFIILVSTIVIRGPCVSLTAISYRKRSNLSDVSG